MVAVADLCTSNLEAARALFPQARAYGCAEDLLASEPLDFCDICTPPVTHRPLIEAAARRGVHLLCEKPLAPTLADAIEIERAVRGTGVIFQPCHQYHYSPQWQAVTRLLPRIGRVYLADYQVHRLAASEGNPHWEPRWRTDRDRSGGGILVDHGTHIFYQLRSVLGEPKTVQGTVHTLLHRGYRVEDTAFVTLDYEDRVARITLTWAARRREILFRFVGERGEILGDEERVRVLADTTEEFPLPGGMSVNSSHSEWYAPLLRDFARRIRGGHRGAGPLEEALYVTRLVARVYESGRMGCALPLIDGHAPGSGGAHASAEAELRRLEAGEPAAVVETMAPARPSRRAQVIRGAALAVLLGAVAWTFHDVDWTALGNAMGSAGLAWIALAAAVNLIALLFQAARWLAVVRPLSSVATLAQSFKAMMVGYTVSMVVPARGGELARAHYLGSRTGVSRSALLGSIVLDHLVNAVGLLAGLAVLPFFVGVPDWMRSGAWVAFALFVAAAMVVAALRPAEKADGDDSRDGPPMRRITSLLAKMQQGLTGARRPRALGISLGASVIAWALEIGVVALALRAVSLDLPLPAAFLVLAAVNLALVFPFTPPGNIGTLELGATLALIGFGVPKATALAFALCYHLLQAVPVGILGTAFVGREAFARTFKASAG
jgi:hypothetical protein